jgi:hypothetical protein
LQPLDFRTLTRTVSERRWRFWGAEFERRQRSNKAWSQNLGHDHVLTTFSNYGDVGSYRQDYTKNAGALFGLVKAGITVTLPKPQTSGAKSDGRFGEQDLVYLP